MAERFEIVEKALRRMLEEKKYQALKDLLGGTIQNMLETELEEQMEDREEEDPEYHDSRNGYKHKTLRSSMGENPHPGTAGPKQRLRAAGGAKV